MPFRRGFIAFSCLEQVICFLFFLKTHHLYIVYTRDIEPLLAESTANSHTTAETVENGGRRRVITYIIIQIIKIIIKIKLLIDLYPKSREV